MSQLATWLTIVLCLSLGWPGGGAAGQAQRGVERLPNEAQASRRVGNRWALIVGVDQYADGGISPLSGAVADAKAIRDALIKYADFPESQAFLLGSDGSSKPTKSAIFEKLSEIKRAAKPGDLLLLFFAGHGVEVDGQRYMLTYDAQCCSAAMIKSSALLASQLMQELESIKVADRIIMVDACRNDPTKGGKELNVADENLEAAFTLQPASEGGLRATFLSASRGQSAYEWTEKRRGFFSYFIELGLRGEAAQFGKVTVTSLLTYLNEMVPKSVREQKNQLQIPYTRVDGSELVLVRPDKLPTLQTALDKPAAPSQRTVYGVVKDSSGAPLVGAKIVAVVITAARAVSPGAKQIELTATSDEDGFFKIDGVDASVDAKITVVKEGYEAKTLSSPPDQAGKKLPIFLPRNLLATTASAARTAPMPAAPAVAMPAIAESAQPAAPATPAAAPTPRAEGVQAKAAPPAAPAPPPSAPAAPRTATAEQPKPTAPPPPASPPARGQTAESKPPAVPPAPAPAAPRTATAEQPKPTAPPPPASPPARGQTAETKAPAVPPAPPPAAPRTATAEPKPAAPTPPASTPPRGQTADTKAAAATPARPPEALAARATPMVPVTAIEDPRAKELSLVAYRTFLAEDFNEAETVARRALEIEPDNVLANAVLGNSIAAIGLAANDSAKTSGAMAFIEKALRRDANEALAHNALGVTLVADKKYDEAAVELQKAIRSDPRLAVAHANLAHVLLKQAENVKNAGNRLKDAEREYREAIRLQPDNSVPYNGLSTVLFSMGRYKDAVKACREAIGRYQLRDSILGLYYVQLAVAQYQDGHQEEAVEAVARAKALGITQHDAYSIIEKGKPQKGRR